MICGFKWNTEIFPLLVNLHNKDPEWEWVLIRGGQGGMLILNACPPTQDLHPSPLHLQWEGERDEISWGGAAQRQLDCVLGFITWKDNGTIGGFLVTMQSRKIYTKLHVIYGDTEWESNLLLSFSWCGEWRHLLSTGNHSSPAAGRVGCNQETRVLLQNGQQKQHPWRSLIWCVWPIHRARAHPATNHIWYISETCLPFLSSPPTQHLI